MMRILWLLLASLLLVVGPVSCSKSEKKAKPEDPLKVDPGERARGLQACKSYVERACRCAKDPKKPGFKKICDQAETHTTSLQMMLDTIVSDQVDNRERLRLIKSARKTIETCFSATAQMDPRNCPVKAP